MAFWQFLTNCVKKPCNTSNFLVIFAQVEAQAQIRAVFDDGAVALVGFYNQQVGRPFIDIAEYTLLFL